MKLAEFFLIISLISISYARPIDEPHLFIKVSNPGGAGSFGAQVSKTTVNLETDGNVSQEVAYPHVPPFLAFKEGTIYAKPPPSAQYFPASDKVKRKVGPSAQGAAASKKQDS